jgi:hypothetical protein
MKQKTGFTSKGLIYAREWSHKTCLVLVQRPFSALHISMLLEIVCSEYMREEYKCGKYSMNANASSMAFDLCWPSKHVLEKYNQEESNDSKGL